MKNPPLSSILLKAMDNAREGITISDVSLPDNPLIYVNQGFLSMSGYTREECLGKNCRYLQGSQTSYEEVAKIREAIYRQAPIQVELLNYHKNGYAFWNALSLTPIFDEEGTLTHYIGVQEDITVKKKLQRRKEELKRQQIINETTFQAQEKERYEIGKELHDNVNQIIATIRLYLKMAGDQPESREEMIEYAIGLTDKLLTEVRQVSHQLAGPVFENTTFSAAITELVQSIQRAAPFTFQCSVEQALEEKITDRQKLVLYRIIQEQISNILKYAKAEKVMIGLTEEEQGVQLAISDDGVGFDPFDKGKGIGFRNISSRVEAEKGTFRLETSPGKGCLLLVYLPYMLRHDRTTAGNN